MHPAKSVILFTIASGAGYGIVVLAAVCELTGLPPRSPAEMIFVLGVALVLIVLGLASSTLHLGHPERAWRAMSQWRTSWLSREGVAALWTFVPVCAWGAAAYLAPGAPAALPVVLAVISGLGALAVLYCTAMIYASLKPVPAWSNSWTPIVYLTLGPMSGAVVLTGLSHIAGFAAGGLDALALILITAGLAVKMGYWRAIDRAPARSSAETATGLAAEGARVELLEAPHTGSNYLMQEMGFRIARKHRLRLRRVVRLLGFGVPGAAFLVCLITAPNAGLSAVALAAGTAGLIAERYLFFAEAKHAQSLYYGESSV
ncbi:MAG: dimethyl sulfoxide reductase anchor subunit family protein [Rhodospirillales bacterium]